MTENSKIRQFWDVSESQISTFSSPYGERITLKNSRIKSIWCFSERVEFQNSTMVKERLSEVVELSQSGGFLRVEFQSFFKHGEEMTVRSSQIKPIWCISESRIFLGKPTVISLCIYPMKEVRGGRRG